MSDPYLLDKDEYKDMEKELKGKPGGIFCPKRNLSIGGDCKGCDEVDRLFRTGDPADKEQAFKRMAKANFYMSIVKPENPAKRIILEVGKKAGSGIIDGVNKHGWTDIAHPLAGKGREMQITKMKGDGGFPNYPVTPNLNKAEWEIDASVLENLPNLDNIIQMLKEQTEDIYKISDLKMDETLNFRICPAWENGQGNKRILIVVWRHYGFSQEEIDGVVPINTSRETTEPTSDNRTLFEGQPSGSGGTVTRERCFGDENFFEEGHPSCTACKWYRDCASNVGKPLA